MLDVLAELILRKAGLRSDRIWTHPWAYRSLLAYIPLALDTWALSRSQYWSRARLQRYQAGRMRVLLSDARLIPLWRSILEGVEPHGDTPASLLRGVPATRKRDLSDRDPAEIRDEQLIPRSDPDNTSGSTGKPLHFRHDWGASLRSFAVTERVFRATGWRYPIVYMRARPRNGFTFYKHVWFYVRGFNSVRFRMEEFGEMAKRLSRGFILYGYTSWVVEFARQMEALGASFPIRKVMVAGEHLTDHDRTFIERITHAELFTLYASRETGFLGFECAEHRMHVSEEWAYLDIVDDAGQRVPHGTEGRILVTTFDNRIMPFIRYEIGDRGVLSDQPCPCGRTLLTLAFKGRTSEIIELEGGRRVALLDISFMLGHYKDSIRHYQLVQTGPISFTVRVVPGPAFEAKREYVEALIARMLHPHVRITWELIDIIEEAPSGKAVYFIRAFS